MIGLAEFCEKAGFQNALSERCHEYLVEKESVGVQVQKPMGMLLRFLRMCLANGEPLDHASKSAVERWNEKDINESPRNHYYRATEIRRFMQHLEKTGIDAYVDRDIRRVQSNFVPYIFSHSEIVRLFGSRRWTSIHTDFSAARLCDEFAVPNALWLRSAGFRSIESCYCGCQFGARCPTYTKQQIWQRTPGSNV